MSLIQGTNSLVADDRLVLAMTTTMRPVESCPNLKSPILSRQEIEK